jgi:hypothetical protein
VFRVLLTASAGETPDDQKVLRKSSHLLVADRNSSKVDASR